MPGRVLAADDALGPDRLDGAERLDLFEADRVGVERPRHFHRHQREQLREVVLHHVAERAGGVVIAGPRADAERFGDRDLDTLDALAVPRRLDEAVAEAQDQQVLNRFLPEIVIDPVDLLLLEVAMDQLVELLRRAQIPAEGFFNHQARPAIVAAMEAGLAEARHRAGKRRGRHRHVERHIGRRVLAAKRVERLAKAAVIIRRGRRPSTNSESDLRTGGICSGGRPAATNVSRTQAWNASRVLAPRPSPRPACSGGGRRRRPACTAREAVCAPTDRPWRRR